jgi:hypothetical protein
LKAYDRIPLAVKEHMGATVAAVATARERAALNGVMLLWFLLTAAAVLFFAIDIHTTRESPILKWGFVLLTAYSGPLGARQPRSA